MWMPVRHRMLRHRDGALAALPGRLQVLLVEDCRQTTGMGDLQAVCEDTVGEAVLAERLPSTRCPRRIMPMPMGFLGVGAFRRHASGSRHLSLAGSPGLS